MAKRLHVYSGGFLKDKRIRRILSLSGYETALGLPAKGRGMVAIWGRTKVSARGLFVAKKRGAKVLTVEDGFLRSVLTGRAGAAPQSLILDRTGVYFDCTGPSDLETILNKSDLSEPELLARAASGIERLHATGLSKYNGSEAKLDVGESGYVLLIDQTRGDASIRLGGADAATFTEMLASARRDHPGKRILIKTHPEVASRYRKGHFSTRDLDENTRLVTEPFTPQTLLAGASAVYCVTSLMGFEAILMGHRPKVFGLPFYGGWGLSADVQTFARRDRTLTPLELFAAAMLLYPIYYDATRDTLCEFETLVDNLEAETRAWREDCRGYAALGISLWKRGHLKRFLSGAGALLSFDTDPVRAMKNMRRGLVWASKEIEPLRVLYADKGADLLRLEDGFLRSRGLGAELVPPLSLVIDDLGIYYDPARESRLERILNRTEPLAAAEIARAERLHARLLSGGFSKYNLDRAGFDWPDHSLRILVPGQVEDDASIKCGTNEVATNFDLLRATRAANPEAFIAYKPHPDVEAGLRLGELSKDKVLAFADVILKDTDPIATLKDCDAVWTMTSLLGFEALMRGKSVTCLGAPFYAGWGLTQDFGSVPQRRAAKPSITKLIHAALIEYPRYYDPVSRQACPVELVLDRIEDGTMLRPGHGNRALAKVQGMFAGFAFLWR